MVLYKLSYYRKFNWRIKKWYRYVW